MSVFSLEGLAEQSVGEALAFGLGLALGRALEPAGVGLAQTAWNLDPNKVLAPGEAAAIVAEDVDNQAWGEDEARQSGINQERFDKLVREVIAAPQFGELITMLRRGTITSELFTHGLRKAKLDPEWDTALTDLQSERLDPAVIAVSGQRGTMTDAGLLPVGPPTAVGRVPPMPVSSLDPIAEAAASGVDQERLAVMMRNVGLPPAPGELLQLVNRGEIDEADFYRGVSEGNTRNEWGPFLLNLKRRLLTPHEYAELALRGYITDADRDAGAALSGLEAADTALLFEMLGRPLAVHQITTGLERGGKFGGTYEGVPEPFLSALRQSNVKPPWGNLAYANRYTYPSAFVLRSLAQSGDLPAADVEPTLLKIGWEPDFAKTVAKAWTGGTAKGGDPHVTKAETQLWNATHKAYVESTQTPAEATADLETLGVATAAVPQVLALWNAERAVRRRSLTPAEIKKAITTPGWDRARAEARLSELGYSADDIQTYLAE